MGAPGKIPENATDTKNTSYVYILKLSRKGNVLNNAKLPWKAFEDLAHNYIYKDQMPAEFSSSGKPPHHKHSAALDGLYQEKSHFMDAIDGVRTVVFKTNDGVTKALIRVDEQNGSQLLLDLERIIGPNTNTRLATSLLGPISWRLGVRVSEPHSHEDSTCPCELQKMEAGSKDCLESMGKEDEHGDVLCKAKQCDPFYICKCDGEDVCRRENNKTETLDVVRVAVDGLYYCRKRNEHRLKKMGHIARKSSVATSIKTSAISDLPKFNKTHCACSPATPSSNFTECLQYVYTQVGKGIICKSSECVGEDDDYVCDTIGTSYCIREWYHKHLFVNDGEKSDENGMFFCHIQYFKQRTTKIM